jgi:hypothetical protein
VRDPASACSSGDASGLVTSDLWPQRRQEATLTRLHAGSLSAAEVNRMRRHPGKLLCVDAKSAEKGYQTRVPLLELQKLAAKNNSLLMIQPK